MVINLPSRRERLNRFNDEILKLFDSNDTEIVNGVIHRKPMVGIATAHQNAVMRAKELNQQYALIMEDDLYVHSEKSREKMETAFRDVPDDFEILLGGIYTGQPTKHSEHWDSVMEFSALHFYVVRDVVYDKILGFDRSQHIDRAMAKSVKNGGLGIKSYVSNPFFCIQYPGFSDNAEKEMDYSHLLKKYKLLK